MNVLTLKEVKDKYELLDSPDVSLEDFIRINYINVYDASFKFIGYELRTEDTYAGVF